MEWRLFLRESILVILFISGWFYGLHLHKLPHKTAQEKIMLPALAKIFFGKSSNNIYSVPGLMVQILSLSILIIFSLLIFDQISRIMAARLFIVTNFSVLIFYVLRMFVVRR